MTPITEEMLGDDFKERSMNSNLVFKIKNSVRGGALCFVLFVLSGLLFLGGLSLCTATACDYLKVRFFLA